MKIRRSLLKGTVTVSTYKGDGAYGPVFDEPVTVPCDIDRTRRLVRNAVGDEVISEAAICMHPDDGGYFRPESKLVIDDMPSKVLSASPMDFRGQTVFVKVMCS